MIVDGSVLGRSSAINQAYVGNYDLWTPSYGGATVTWGGSKSQDGKNYDVLTVTPPNSSVPIDVWNRRRIEIDGLTCGDRSDFPSSDSHSDHRDAMSHCRRCSGLRD